MKKKLIVGNWKMNGTMDAAHSFIAEFSQISGSNALDAIYVICPPFPYLHLFENQSIACGAQNCHWEKSGPFTGDVSAEMLVELGCRYVIVGHSERRQSTGETNETVLAKARAVRNAGITPIICVGETEEEYNNGKTISVLKKQIQGSVPKNESNYVVAYEPIWAIGTGRIATTDDITKVFNELRTLLGNDITLLYGGSVKPDNAKEILSLHNVGGVLVGGASLNATDFFAIGHLK
jgi:triosephosphate isomerase